MSTQFVAFLILAQIAKMDAFAKSVNLTSSRAGFDGIQLLIREPHVDTTNDTLHINPKTQDDTDLELKLDKNWGFHPNVASTLHIIIDGFTPNITKTDGEFLMLFAVDNHEYFSVVIRLESRAAWSSYPSYEEQPLATSDDIFLDIIAPSTPNRWNRLSDNDQWTNIGPGTWYKKALEWPLHITITNDPVENMTIYQCINCVLTEKILTVSYTSSFATEKGMNVYIMNDASDGKPFDIYSITVTYEYYTESPTYAPTLSPTTLSIAPSIAPSLSSIAPSNAPTTAIPTKAPSTPSPTIIVVVPTKHPTNEKEVEYIESTQSKTTSFIETISDKMTNSDNELVRYLVIVIIVIFVCFVISCVVVAIIYKRKTREMRASDTQYHHPVDYNQSKPALNMVASQSSAANIVHTSHDAAKSMKKFKHHSIPTVDEDFNAALENIVAGDQAMLDDVCHQIATAGADDNDDNDVNEQNEEQQMLNKYAEGRSFHQRTESDVIEEGIINRETIDVAMSYEEKINSLNNERAQNIMLNVRTKDGDLIIDDEYETIGAHQPQ